MPATVQVRPDPEFEAQLKRLAHAWGGIKPLTISDVIREAVRRADAAEIRGKKNSRKTLDVS